MAGYKNISTGKEINNLTEDQFIASGLVSSEWENLDEYNARQWRNRALADSDWIVPITDHPQRTAYLTYRTALRDWPSTSDFPDTKPTL